MEWTPNCRGWGQHWRAGGSWKSSWKPWAELLKARQGDISFIKNCRVKRKSFFSCPKGEVLSFNALVYNGFHSLSIHSHYFMMSIFSSLLYLYTTFLKYVCPCYLVSKVTAMGWTVIYFVSSNIETNGVTIVSARKTWYSKTPWHPKFLSAGFSAED